MEFLKIQTFGFLICLCLENKKTMVMVLILKIILMKTYLLKRKYLSFCSKSRTTFCCWHQMKYKNGKMIHLSFTLIKKNKLMISEVICWDLKQKNWLVVSALDIALVLKNSAQILWVNSNLKNLKVVQWKLKLKKMQFTKF